MKPDPDPFELGQRAARDLSVVTARPIRWYGLQ
jgi:hypothetical protein